MKRPSYVTPHVIAQHGLPLDLLLTDDGTTPHGPECPVCELFGLPIAQLGRLFREASAGHRSSVLSSERTCEWCGLEYLARSGRFCCTDCRQRAHRAGKGAVA